MSQKSTSNIPPPEDRFHTNTLKMTTLIEKIVVEANKTGYDDVTPFMVRLATNYLNRNFDKVSLIEGFIRCSHPHSIPNDPNSALDHGTWDKILAKDEAFFHDKAFDIFQGLPPQAIDAFRRLYKHKNPRTGKSIIGDEDREEIISYFHAFVKISIKFVHAKREPYVMAGPDGKDKYVYKNPTYFRGIDIKTHAQKWGIQLEFSRG